MALMSWKAFKFFDVSQIQFPEAERNALFEGNITSVASGSDNVFFGSSDGVVRILSRAFKVVRSFKAHDSGSITHMKQVQGTSLLVTVAEDLSNEPVLKVWALDKLEKKTGIPRCQSTLNIQNGRKQFPISAFASLEDLSQLAVGFANGAVTVVRGDLIHDRGTRQRTVFESEEPITNIAFREGNITTLYIATTGRIATLVISGRGQGQPAKSLDENGCGVDCMTVDKSTQDVIVARDDAIYTYGMGARGPVYAYTAHKKMVSIFKDYIAVVAPPQGMPTKGSSMRTFGVAQANEIFNTTKFTLLNTDLQFIAHQESLSSEVKFMFSEWGDLFLLTLDGKLFRYQEKRFQQKLDILYQRKLYIMAISLAQKAGVDDLQRNVILRKYGDFLYQKGDFDTAMQQYLKAIDNTEPSQVIQKFLDTQRIHNLIEYLEELHEHHKATSDHTTLLLNCYAKLKDVEKLEEFIKSPSDLKFDLDTAITMCRQGGYFDQAAYLARKHNEHELVVDILIEDSKRYAEALAYIWRLEPVDAYHNLMKSAIVLLEHCPQDTTKLLIDYYSGRFRPKKDAVVIANAPPSSGGMGIATTATTAVQNLAALLPLPYMNSTSDQAPSSAGQATSSQTQVVETNTDDPPAEYSVPKPRTAFSAFVDHPAEFITFLESLTGSSRPDSSSEADKTDLYTTLFEMYLQTASSFDPQTSATERAEWESKAKRLIEGKNIPIDNSNVLLLSDLSNFKAGTILVREHQGLRFDIFRSYTSAKDTQGALKALHKYGPEEPQLYPAALSYLTSTQAILASPGVESEIANILSKIAADNLMAPLQVVQALSANGVATVGLVKQYLQRTIETERKAIEANRATIKAYRDDTEKKLQDLRELGGPKPQVFQATRCAACGAGLELPVVHFLCKHSFHQRCINPGETASSSSATAGSLGGAMGALSLEDAAGAGAGGGLQRERVGHADEGVIKAECPVCAPQNETMRAIRRAQEESKEKHDVFLDALGRSTDRFGTVSEWFGRGVMGVGGAD